MRQSLRVNGGVERQEQLCARKGNRKGYRGFKQIDEGQTGNGKKSQARKVEVKTTKRAPYTKGE